MSEETVKTGGSIAKRARLELEEKTQKKVVSNENYLPPMLPSTQNQES